MFNSVTSALQFILPKQLLTCLAGWLANKKAGWLTQLVIKLFIKVYKVDMQEAAQPDPNHYATFNEFFTRALQPDARPIDNEPGQLTFPVDGTISQFGKLNATCLVQAKNHDYSLEALLACDKEQVTTFTNGSFITTYLSPRDYHRVHMPCDGTLREMVYVPGSLFSVSQETAERIPNLFARNERVICYFDTPFGPMAQILVGATIVGSIVTQWAGCITPPRLGIMQRWQYPGDGEGAIKLQKGEEMGYFQLGSTVINLFAEDRILFCHRLHNTMKVKMGEMMAQCPTTDTID